MHLPMENNTQNRPPQRKRIPTKDLLLILLTVLVIFRVDWRNMNSFHYLILFLLILCFMLRWSNMRKDAQRREMLARRQETEEAAQASADEAETIPPEAISVEGEAISPEETAQNGTEEKPE